MVVVAQHFPRMQPEVASRLFCIMDSNNRHQIHYLVRSVPHRSHHNNLTLTQHQTNMICPNLFKVPSAVTAFSAIRFSFCTALSRAQYSFVPLLDNLRNCCCSGDLDFRELMCALSIVVRGSPEEKVRAHNRAQQYLFPPFPRFELFFSAVPSSPRLSLHLLQFI